MKSLNPLNPPAPSFVGIDVSQDTLDVCILPEAEILTVTNTPEGRVELRDRLIAAQPRLIVLEATGGLERAIKIMLEQAGLNVARVNPRHPRAFAIASGQRAKTDRIDALNLAQFAATLIPSTRGLSDQGREQLQALVKRRDTLKRTLGDEKKRLLRCLMNVQDNIDAHIAFINASVKSLETQIQRALEADPARMARVKLLETTPGVGRVTSSVLVSSFPELGMLSSAEAAALAGLAPFARESGRWKGQRFISGGRVLVRCALYMAAVSGVRWNVRLKALYERLRGRGKPAKLALVACARVLLVMLNAMVRDGRPFNASLVGGGT